MDCADPETDPLEAAQARAAAALEELIVVTVRKSTGRSRFAQAGRICEVGQRLMRATGQRAEDFKEDDRLNGRRLYQLANDGIIGGIPAPPIPDGQAGMRSIVGALMPQAEAQTQASIAAAAASRAEELRSLLDLLPRLPEDRRAGAQARIEALLTEMEAPRHDPPEPASVVSPELLRGHSPAEGGRGPDGAPRLPAHTGGADGHGGAAAAGAPAGAPAEGVGNG